MLFRSLPFTGQALRQAVERADLRALMAMAEQLRVAGYRVEPQRLASDLLRHGCSSVVDAFGRRVPLQVHVPAPNRIDTVDPTVAFRIAA